jgi:4-hydroxy-3-methylbut-2-enyl diphosphate reductase
MKSVVNKSGSKVYIIQNTDKKVSLETIAKNKGWRMDEMLEEMETIAASGTKLNLDYAIDDMLDEYEQQDIIDYFKTVFVAKFGEREGPQHVGGAGKKDTLCYATQVNQDALQRALAEPLDAAFIIGGKNSSNTYQLYRLCEQKLGQRAYFIQSEANIRSKDEIEHYVFPAAGHGHGGHIEVHPLWPGDDSPKRVLITGGASCPDGLVQQVMARINSFFSPEKLRSVESVLEILEAP